MTHRGEHRSRAVTALLVLAALLAAVVATAAAQGGPTDRQPIDTEASRRGRRAYTQYCINCHGSTAKGTDDGPDLIRSLVVLRDRFGDRIGPALAPSGTHETAFTPRLTPAQVLDLSHFLHERIEDTARNRNPTQPIDVMTGDPEAGREYFFGAGTCSTCHSPTGDLAGVARRIPVGVNLQQRFLFPVLSRDGGRQVEVTVTPAGGRPVRGRLVRIDDFTVALRDAGGEYRAVRRTPTVSVEVHDPLEAHHRLLDRYTDEDIHDVVTYLGTLE
jgi:mono/diheme cytochrome c family protein